MGALHSTDESSLNIAQVAGDWYKLKTEREQEEARNAYSADTLAALAARKDIEADLALKEGELNLAELAAAQRLDQSSLGVGYAASGVKVDSGSAAATAADRAAWNEYDRQRVEYDAEMESWGLRYDAALLRLEAANTLGGAGSSGSGLKRIGSAVS